ncbi:MAG: OmpH family outer membrane protein [Candidatus Azobacteroides sp.]|nr:OmpH family outer membrane protein [Candidatus Azobacteroides sp.]
MFKKIVLFALVMFPVIGFAQETQKIAYVNYFDVVMAMPEYKQMQDSLKKSDSEFQAELKVLSDEYAKKVSDYVAQRDSLNESIKLRREQEIEEIRQRADNFQQYAAQKQDELQQSLSVPIQTKLQKAIDDVGKESNFLYIANSQAFSYISATATDATPLIKRKLGIQ